MTYYRSRFINNKKNNKKIWKDINGLLGRTNKREVVGVVGDGGEMLTGKSMADKFNEFFSTVAESLVSLVPHVLDNGNHGNHGNVNNRYYNYINSNQRSCFLYPTNIVELLHVFTILTDKCNVLFDVKPTLLFLVKERIFPVLVYLYNLSIEKGKYPGSLKLLVLYLYIRVEVPQIQITTDQSQTYLL